jgi:hypothetical protein
LPCCKLHCRLRFPSVVEAASPVEASACAMSPDNPYEGGSTESAQYQSYFTGHWTPLSVVRIYHPFNVAEMLSLRGSRELARQVKWVISPRATLPLFFPFYQVRFGGDQTKQKNSPSKCLFPTTLTDNHPRTRFPQNVSEIAAETSRQRS